MVRTRRILEVLEQDRLIAKSVPLGAYLLDQLGQLAAAHPDKVSEPRGRGLMCAVTLATPDLRDRVVTALRERQHVLLLGTGTSGLRFRPPLTVTEEELERAVDALDAVLTRERL